MNDFKEQLAAAAAFTANNPNDQQLDDDLLEAVGSMPTCPEMHIASDLIECIPDYDFLTVSNFCTELPNAFKLRCQVQKRDMLVPKSPGDTITINSHAGKILARIIKLWGIPIQAFINLADIKVVGSLVDKKGRLQLMANIVQTNGLEMSLSNVTFYAAGGSVAVEECQMNGGTSVTFHKYETATSVHGLATHGGKMEKFAINRFTICTGNQHTPAKRPLNALILDAENQLVSVNRDAPYSLLTDDRFEIKALLGRIIKVSRYENQYYASILCSAVVVAQRQVENY